MHATECTMCNCVDIYTLDSVDTSHVMTSFFESTECLGNWGTARAVSIHECRPYPLI